MYRLQRSTLKSARTWRLKEGLRSTYATGLTSNCPTRAEADLQSWISWARRSWLEPFKKLATPLKERLADVVRVMLEGRSNAYVDAMNGMLQWTKLAAQIFHREELRRHRLSHVQTEELAAQSDATETLVIYHLPCRPSVSTENGVEPILIVQII